MGVVIVVVTAILSSYAANLEDRVAALDGQLRQNEQERDRDTERAMVNAQQQVKVVGTLLEGKRYWTQALQLMQEMLRSSVRLDRMEATAADDTITFHAVADSYATVARQLRAFIDGDGVTDISVSSVRTTPGGVEFDGVVTIDTKNVLLRSPEEE